MKVDRFVGNDRRASSSNSRTKDLKAVLSDTALIKSRIENYNSFCSSSIKVNEPKECSKTHTQTKCNLIIRTELRKKSLQHEANTDDTESIAIL